MPDPQFLRTTTILPVVDTDAACAWYDHALGLTAAYVHGAGRRGEAADFANYAVLRRDGVEVHLILDEGGPAWTRAGTGHLSLTVRDVDAVHAELVARAVPVTRPLQRQSWPARGFNLTDASGNDVHVEQPG
jgi:uncharacterized glyoxalase superfamily protein PhnB